MASLGRVRRQFGGKLAGNKRTVTDVWTPGNTTVCCPHQWGQLAVLNNGHTGEQRLFPLRHAGEAAKPSSADT